MRSLLFTVALLVVAAWGCSGSGSDSTSMSMPTPSTTSASANASTINIVSQDHAFSFDPNPAAIPQGSLVVWHNIDTTAHHIVMNDGSFDSGIIAPGTASQLMRLTSAGGNYHCTIHPTTMFGGINMATMEPPSSPGY